MSILDIKTYPDPVLKAVAKEFDEVGEAERKLAWDMIETMYASDGVGLAAPQVGVSKRLIVCSPRQKRGEEFVYFNPVIVERSGEEISNEGCLSLPGISGEVKRATTIRLQALSPKGEKLDLKIEGFLARVIQHEVDHLDGTLFIDRVRLGERKALIETYLDTRVL